MQKLLEGNSVYRIAGTPYSVDDVFDEIAADSEGFDAPFPPKGKSFSSGHFRFKSRNEMLKRAQSIVSRLNALPDPIPVYRAVSGLTPGAALNDTGEHWSFSKKSAFAYGHTHGRKYLISGKAPRNRVNWNMTMIKNAHFSVGLDDDDNENEINIDSEDVMDKKLESI